MTEIPDVTEVTNAIFNPLLRHTTLMTLIAPSDEWHRLFCADHCRARSIGEGSEVLVYIDRGSHANYLSNISVKKN